MARTQLKERPAQASLLPDPEPAPAAKLPAKPKPTKPEPSNAVAIAKPQPLAKPASLLELCMMAARSKDMDADKTRAFLDMAKQQEREEAEILFDEAMLAAQREMPQVPRDSYNKHTKAWWARIEGVSAKCDPVIRKHGFTLKFGMGEPRMESHYHVFADVTWVGSLASGKKASCTKRWDLDVGRDDVGAKGGGTKTGAQGSMSVLTYGKRNLKLSIFDVLVLGMDRDGNPAGREPVTSSNLKELRKQMKEVNIDEAVVCDFCKIETLDQIGADQLETVNERIEQRKALSK